MDQFLNPKSMMTPGFAGGLIMLLANSVCVMFPEFPFRFVALGLSFLVGFGAMAAIEAQVGARVIYWVVNSLIIFSIGVGTSNIGANIAQQAAPRPQAGTSITGAVAPELLSFFIADAMAQDKSSGSKTDQRDGFFRRW